MAKRLKREGVPILSFGRAARQARTQFAPTGTNNPMSFASVMVVAGGAGIWR